MSLGFGPTFTVAFFLRLFPDSVLGAECAAIFAIFTSQAWNMAFSFYQSLRTVPRDLDEVARHYRLSPWLRFWRLDVPFAAPGLIWNTMMSMSGGWFFVVASEAIIREYLTEAMGYAEAGILPPKVEREIELPDELVEALESDPELAQAFAVLTPGRQRSYVYALNSAKTSATKVTRIIKYRDRILAGKGALDR